MRQRLNSFYFISWQGFRVIETWSEFRHATVQQMQLFLLPQISVCCVVIEGIRAFPEEEEEKDGHMKLEQQDNYGTTAMKHYYMHKQIQRTTRNASSNHIMAEVSRESFKFQALPLLCKIMLKKS